MSCCMIVLESLKFAVGRLTAVAVFALKEWLRQGINGIKYGIIASILIVAVVMGLDFVLPPGSIAPRPSGPPLSERDKSIQLQGESLQREMESDREMQQRDLEAKVRAVQIDMEKHPELYR